MPLSLFIASPISAAVVEINAAPAKKLLGGGPTLPWRIRIESP
jgi:hypothetical protein